MANPILDARRRSSVRLATAQVAEYRFGVGRVPSVSVSTVPSAERRRGGRGRGHTSIWSTTPTAASSHPLGRATSGSRSWDRSRWRPPHGGAPRWAPPRTAILNAAAGVSETAVPGLSGSRLDRLAARSSGRSPCGTKLRMIVLRHEAARTGRSIRCTEVSTSSAIRYRFRVPSSWAAVLAGGERTLVRHHAGCPAPRHGLIGVDGHNRRCITQKTGRPAAASAT